MGLVGCELSLACLRLLCGKHNESGDGCVARLYCIGLSRYKHKCWLYACACVYLTRRRLLGGCLARWLLAVGFCRCSMSLQSHFAGAERIDYENNIELST